MTQNTADPAPANQNNGNDNTPTAVYWWAKLISLPVINRTEYFTIQMMFVYITPYTTVEAITGPKIMITWEYHDYD